MSYERTKQIILSDLKEIKSEARKIIQATTICEKLCLEKWPWFYGPLSEWVEQMKKIGEATDKITWIRLEKRGRF